MNYGAEQEVMEGTRTKGGPVEEYRAFVPFVQLADEPDQSQEDYAVEQRLRVLGNTFVQERRQGSV